MGATAPETRWGCPASCFKTSPANLLGPSSKRPPGRTGGARTREAAGHNNALRKCPGRASPPPRARGAGRKATNNANDKNALAPAAAGQLPNDFLPPDVLAYAPEPILHDIKSLESALPNMDIAELVRAPTSHCPVCACKIRVPAF